ncbi:MAG: hypothetical protein ACF8NJ_09985 [Phycisphaerales bacterium JB038]
MECENGKESLLDCRRRDRRALTERILLRAEWLEPADRALLESVYADQVPIARLARLRGHSPQRLRRRVRKLVGQLLAPSTSYVLSRRSDWGRERWQVACKHLVAGRDLRRTAADLGLTLHTVRKHVEAVRTLFEAEKARA